MTRLTNIIRQRIVANAVEKATTVQIADLNNMIGVPTPAEV